MRAAELIVGRAWAEELLRRHGCMAFALDAAREACQDARDRLAAAQRSGDPRRINLAHDALEYAIEYETPNDAPGASGESSLARKGRRGSKAGKRHS